MRKRIILGAGQCGMKLAHSYYNAFPRKDSELVALSTSTEDSVGIPRSSLIQVAVEGSGKKFSNGLQIWESHFDKLLRGIDDIRESDIIYFTSAGGGSGSSSVKYVPEILMEPAKKNRVFLVVVLPFGYEQLPFKPNALQAINVLESEGHTNRVSVMLFNNDALGEVYRDLKPDGTGTINLEKINEHIINSTSLVLDLITAYHDQRKYSPFTIDELEHESVIFSNGFIGVEAVEFDSEAEEPNFKFEYGKLQSAKNLIIAKVIQSKESDYIVNQGVGAFMERVKLISKKAKNARVMYGIIRTDRVNNGTYIVIANNLDVARYMEKIKKRIKKNVKGFLREDGAEKILSTKERQIFDI